MYMQTCDQILMVVIKRPGLGADRCAPRHLVRFSLITNLLSQARICKCTHHRQGSVWVLVRGLEQEEYKAAIFALLCQFVLVMTTS